MEPKKHFIVGTMLCLIIFLSSCSGVIQKDDDWEYSGGGIADKIKSAAQSYGGSFGSVGSTSAPTSSMMMYKSESVGQNIGFSVGGAKDINNFRENIKNGYLPVPTDVTYEGLFYDYYFDTGMEDECLDLFCPSYSYAISEDPFSNETEYYLSVGLNSGMKQSDFQRKKLNLVVVLDISGSMSSSFNRYYYDRIGRPEEADSEDAGKSKMEIASEAVVGMLDHLNDDDSFGMVLFDSNAFLGKPLSRVGDTDMDAIEDHILELGPRGGTNMESGMAMATELFDEYLEADQDEYENRIIFLTDAMPNIGVTSEGGLLGMTKGNAKNKVHTTFIGIGVDFNTELIEHITKIRGSNYYSVHSSKEFKERMDDEFEYMVTPLVFDLELELETDGFEIEKVYGSPEADEATGKIMKINTLFPSERKDGETKGGVVIVKLKKTSSNAEMELEVSYEDREGNKKNVKKEVEIGSRMPDYFKNNGIRKAILLSRYASLLKTWMIDERSNHVRPSVDFDEDGIPDDGGMELGRWERQSINLRVSEDYEDLFEEFKDYFEEEMDEIGDDTLGKEVEILELLA